MSYPKWIYKKRLKPKIVKDAEEHAKYPDWVDIPQDTEWQREYKKALRKAKK